MLLIRMPQTLIKKLLQQEEKTMRMRQMKLLIAVLTIIEAILVLRHWVKLVYIT